jgi:phosphoglycolate phosphatase
MKQYDLFIFDWDGTLMNTTQTIVDATTHACRVLNLTVVSDDDAKSIIGKSFVEVVSDIVPELRGNSGLLQRFTAVYERYLNDHTLDNPLFSHVKELLDKLTADGKLLAVATGRSRVMLDDILKGTGFGHYFMLTKTACECFSKPHPQMIEEILDITMVDKSKAIMIGDTSHDIHMAHNAGIDAVGVCHGAQARNELVVCKPKYLLNDITELYNFYTEA